MISCPPPHMLMLYFDIIRFEIISSIQYPYVVSFSNKTGVFQITLLLSLTKIEHITTKNKLNTDAGGTETSPVERFLAFSANTALSRKFGFNKSLLSTYILLRYTKFDQVGLHFVHKLVKDNWRTGVRFLWVEDKNTYCWVIFQNLNLIIFWW